MMEIETISAGELDKFYDSEKALVIDLRSPKEFARMHSDGAVNIPSDELENTERLEKDKLLVLYCDRGSASLIAARELQARGYRVNSVVGGIRAYRGSNLYFPRRHSRMK